MRERRQELGWDLSELSYRTNISQSKLEMMEAGDFSFDKDFYMKVYLERIGKVLELNTERLLALYEMEKREQKKEVKEEVILRDRGIAFYIISAVMGVLMVLEAVHIERILTLPYAYLKNTSPGVITVDGRKVLPGQEIPIYKNIRVNGNSSEVIVREISGRVIRVRIRNFEVIVGGRGKGP